MQKGSNKDVNQSPASTVIAREADLIALAKQGDRAAFSDLVGLHRRGVISVVYRMCGDADLAEDAAQEAFIRAWKNIHRYQPRSPFRNWVYRIATNAALDVLRRERKTANIDTLPLTSPLPNPETAAETEEKSIFIQTAILALPEASRTVIILREYEGLSYREIASTLNIPIGTVMSRLNYARKRLRKILGPIMEVP
jgi:RNA polymerase sigma-70 factor (ECF subfamily)